MPPYLRLMKKMMTMTPQLTPQERRRTGLGEQQILLVASGGECRKQ
jgi:hypothetical protein